MDELIAFLFGWLSSSNSFSTGAASTSGAFSTGSNSASGAGPHFAGQSTQSSSSFGGLEASDNATASVSSNGGSVTGQSEGSGFPSESFFETVGGTQISSSSGAAQAVPEVDAGAAPLAIAVIAATVVLVYERKKRGRANE